MGGGIRVQPHTSKIHHALILLSAWSASKTLDIKFESGIRVNSVSL